MKYFKLFLKHLIISGYIDTSKGNYFIWIIAFYQGLTTHLLLLYSVPWSSKEFYIKVWCRILGGKI